MDEDDVIIFRKIVVFNYFLVKLLQQDIILELTVTQLQQKFLGASRIFSIQGKFQIQQIFSQSAGKGLLENIKIFKGFFFRKGKEGFLDLCFDVFFSVHVAAADTGNGTFFVGILLSDFKDFFFVHTFTSFYKETSYGTILFAWKAGQLL